MLVCVCQGQNWSTVVMKIISAMRSPTIHSVNPVSSELEDRHQDEIKGGKCISRIGVDSHVVGSSRLFLC